MNRREFITATAAGLVLSSGCLGSGYSNIDKDLSKVEFENPSMGKGLKVEAYVDYACPHCQNFHKEKFPEIKNLARNLEIEYVHHNFPLPVKDPLSYKAAVASRSVYHQSSMENTYWQFNSYLYWRPGGDYLTFARKSGLNSGEATQIKTDIENKKYLDEVLADKKRGKERGVEGTPTIFVGDTKVENWEKVTDVIKEKI